MHITVPVTAHVRRTVIVRQNDQNIWRGLAVRLSSSACECQISKCGDEKCWAPTLERSEVHLYPVYFVAVYVRSCAVVGPETVAENGAKPTCGFSPKLTVMEVSPFAV